MNRKRMTLCDDENLCNMCDETFSELFEYEIEPHVIICVCKDCLIENSPTSSKIPNGHCDLCGAPASCSDHYNNYCDDCYENTYGE